MVIRVAVDACGYEHLLERDLAELIYDCSLGNKTGMKRNIRKCRHRLRLAPFSVFFLTFFRASPV